MFRYNGHSIFEGTVFILITSRLLQGKSNLQVPGTRNKHGADRHHTTSENLQAKVSAVVSINEGTGDGITCQGRYGDNHEARPNTNTNLANVGDLSHERANHGHETSRHATIDNSKSCDGGIGMSGNPQAQGENYTQ
jgi:hypothetical protein